MWSLHHCRFKKRAAIPLLLACQTLKFVAAGCVPYPIAARIGNVTLSNGQTSRGIAYSVGSPQQEFAFLPQWYDNSFTTVLLHGVLDIVILFLVPLG
jgi:hypothetical protein